MAHQRSRRKRRPAQLITSVAVLALTLGSCGAASGGTGWFATDGGEPLASIAFGPGVREVVVSVELPPGYEAAEEFAQRMTISAGDEAQTDVQSGLARAFRLPLPSDAGGDTAVELLLGFCEADVKEVCYVDTASLAIVEGAATHIDTPTVTLTYRPEEPK
jgi:hypothetical protein